MHYVYILENDSGRHYIGSCSNLVERVSEHNSNSVRSTKNKGPFKLIYTEKIITRGEARKREIQLKSYKRFSYLKKILKINSTLSSSLV